jgi:hypothetical protein
VTGVDDFYRESHRRIFQAMVDLADRGHPIDAITLTDSLRSRGVLEQILRESSMARCPGTGRASLSKASSRIPSIRRRQPQKLGLLAGQRRQDNERNNVIVVEVDGRPVFDPPGPDRKVDQMRAIAAVLCSRQVLPCWGNIHPRRRRAARCAHCPESRREAGAIGNE